MNTSYSACLQASSDRKRVLWVSALREAACLPNDPDFELKMKGPLQKLLDSSCIIA